MAAGEGGGYPVGMTSPNTRSYGIHFIIVFLFICLNLRLSVSATDPILPVMMRDLGLNVSSSGLFALLPIMALGVAAPLGARLVSWVRPRVLIALALCLAIGGIVWRSYGGGVGLFGGTVVIGLGLGVAGSVILGVVKELFPGRVPELMGAYTACVCMGTSLGSAVSDPITIAMGGWQRGLLFWAWPLLLALLLWVELISRAHPFNLKQNTLKASLLPLLRQGKAWWVSVFYLFRVSGAWMVIVWLSTLMHRRGLSLEESGLVLGLATACEIPATLLSDHLTQWLGSKSRLLWVAIPLSIIALVGLLLGPLHWWPLFSVLFGLCIGAVFALGMTLIVENSADSATTVALSGMAQGMGFIAGGLLAWGAGAVVDLPHARIWVCVVYAIFALGGLVSGLHSDSPSRVTVTPPS